MKQLRPRPVPPTPAHVAFSVAAVFFLLMAALFAAQAMQTVAP